MLGCWLSSAWPAETLLRQPTITRAVTAIQQTTAALSLLSPSLTIIVVQCEGHGQEAAEEADFIHHLIPSEEKPKSTCEAFGLCCRFHYGEGASCKTLINRAVATLLLKVVVNVSRVTEQ